MTTDTPAPAPTQEARVDRILQLLRPTAPVPGRTTPCDRCGRELAGPAYRVGRGQFGGSEATWWVCEACDHSLTVWWYADDPPAEFSGT